MDVENQIRCEQWFETTDGQRFTEWDKAEVHQADLNLAAAMGETLTALADLPSWLIVNAEVVKQYISSRRLNQKPTA